MLLRLADTLREIEQYRRHDPLRFYNPNPKQTQFHKAKHRIRLFIGANQSGKSEAGLAEVAAAVLGYRPWLPQDHPQYRMPFKPPVSIRLVATDFNATVRPVVEPKLLKWFPEMLSGMGYSLRRHQPGSALSAVMTPNGSQIHIITHTQFEKLKSGEGWTGNYLYFDEPFPEKAWASSLRGCIAKGGYAWMTLTPALNSPHAGFIYDNFYLKSTAFDEDSEIFSVQSSMYDNVGYGIGSNEDVELFKRNIPEYEWPARIYGEFSHLMGPVYSLEGEDAKNFWIEPFEVPKNWTRYIAIDPHPKKDTFVSFVAVSEKEDAYVVDEIESPMPADVIAKIILEKEPTAKDWNSTTTILIDSSYESFVSASKDSPNFLQVLRDNGIRCKHDIFEHKQGSVNAGITAVKQMLFPMGEASKTRLKFFKTLRGHREQFGRYLWAENNKPIPKFDDFPACIRAIVSHGARFVSAERKSNMFDSTKIAHFGA